MYITVITVELDSIRLDDTTHFLSKFTCEREIKRHLKEGMEYPDKKGGLPGKAFLLNWVFYKHVLKLKTCKECVINPSASYNWLQKTWRNIPPNKKK